MHHRIRRTPAAAALLSAIGGTGSSEQSDIEPFVLNLAQGGAPGMRPSAVADAVLIAASANNLAKAGYAIGFGSRTAAERPAFLLAALALLGFAAASAYLM
jgi:uncharacterized membrane protein (DUF4010 family)